MEEKQYPIAYLTLTRRVQELGASVISSLDTQLNTDYELVTTLVTEGGTFNASADLKGIIFKDLETTYDEETHKVQTTWTFRNGMSAVDTYTLPMSSITTDGLMSKEQFSKLDQVVLYGTNFASQGEQYAVRQDEDHDLYVVVPKGEVAIASKDETGVVQLYANQLTIPVETTLYSSDLKVPVQMDSRNKLFVEVPNYILPEATTTAYGGVKLFVDKQETAKELTPTNIGEDLPVQLDTNGKAFVNNEISQIVKLYSYEEVSVQLDIPITTKVSSDEHLSLGSFTKTLIIDPNIQYFKTSLYELDKLVLGYEIGTVTIGSKTSYVCYTTTITTENISVFELDEEHCFIKIPNGTLTYWDTLSKSYKNADYTNFELYIDFKNESNSYVCINTTYSFSLRVISAGLEFSTLTGEIESISPIQLSYTGYTGYVVINGKAYLL